MNTAIQQTDADQIESHHDPKGAQLCQTLVHLTLEKMIGQVKNEEPTFAELCNALHKCCQLKKAHTAQEKIRSTERIARQRLNTTGQTDPNRAHQKAGDANQPNPPENEQSHEQFCQTLTEAAKDIWGIDISHFHKPKKKNDSPSHHPTTLPPGLPFGGPPPKPDNPQPSPPNQHHPNPLAPSRPPQPPTTPGESNHLYDIPPQYRQGATPIKDSQQEYGQPKYTHNEWRKAMHQAIRANYGIYDDLPQNNDPKTDPTEPNHPQKPDQSNNNPTHPP